LTRLAWLTRGAWRAELEAEDGAGTEGVRGPLLVRGKALVLRSELRVLKGLLEVVRNGLADRTTLRYDKGHTSVAVMNACEAMRATSLGKLGKAVGEAAEGGAGCNGNQAEGRNRDACARVEAVQQKYESSHRYGRDRE
jgi:hypothetical protein